jgi:hypothetical protein
LDRERDRDRERDLCALAGDLDLERDRERDRERRDFLTGEAVTTICSLAVVLRAGLLRRDFAMSYFFLVRECCNKKISFCPSFKKKT